MQEVCSTVKLLSKAGRIFDSAIASFAMLAAVVLAFGTGLVNTQVVMRRFLHSPILWELEVTEFCLLYITFLGAAWVLKEEGHVSVDIVVNRLSPKTKIILNIIISIIGIAAFILFTWYGTRLTIEFFQTSFYLGTASRTPKGPIMMIIPFGSFFMIIQFIRRLHKNWELWHEYKTSAITATKIGV